MRSGKMIDRAARDEERQQVLGREEWCRRYVHTMVCFGDVERRVAKSMAVNSWLMIGKEEVQPCPCKTAKQERWSVGYEVEDH